MDNVKQIRDKLQNLILDGGSPKLGLPSVQWHRHFSKIDHDNHEKRKMVELLPFKIGIKKIPIPSGPSKAHPFRPFNPNHRTFRYDFTETILSTENEIKFQVFDVDKPSRIYGEISFDNAGDIKIYGKKNFTVILKPENSLQIICYSRNGRQFKNIELFHCSKYDESKKLRCVIL